MSFPHRGDLYWVNLDPTIGSEIKKTRPCVVISPDAANQAGPLVIVAPISKAEEKKVFFHEVPLTKGIAGLSFDRNVPRKPRLVGGVKGHNINETSFPGSPALWAGSFTQKSRCSSSDASTRDA